MIRLGRIPQFQPAGALLYGTRKRNKYEAEESIIENKKQDHRRQGFPIPNAMSDPALDPGLRPIRKLLAKTASIISEAKSRFH